MPPGHLVMISMTSGSENAGMSDKFEWPVSIGKLGVIATIIGTRIGDNMMNTCKLPEANKRKRCYLAVHLDRQNQSQKHTCFH